MDSAVLFESPGPGICPLDADFASRGVWADDFPMARIFPAFPLPEVEIVKNNLTFKLQNKEATSYHIGTNAPNKIFYRQNKLILTNVLSGNASLNCKAILALLLTVLRILTTTNKRHVTHT